MEAGSMLFLMALLLVKHYIADFPLQVPKHYINKGTYGHWGGIEHAMIHGVGTFIVLLFWLWPMMAMTLALLDAVIHYHVDWFKVNVSSSQEWSKYVEKSAGQQWEIIPAHLGIFSNNYFQALGLDQLAHHMTYVMIACMVIK